MPQAALFDFLPALKGRIPYVPLGDWPTPLKPLGLANSGRHDIFVKREDLSAQAYGGNKVRTLEMLLAQAAELGARRVWSTGAFGSNHALAAAIHCPRLGLGSSALLFPQPATRVAAENMEQLLSLGVRVVALRTILSFPFRLAWICARSRREKDYVMLPGGAVPLGALGHVGAAFELATQIKAGLAPWPSHLIVACGSTCTVAGLLAGLRLAEHLGVWQAPLPLIHALRVTPWPVTAAGRIVGLARRTANLVEQMGGPKAARGMASYRSLLRVHGRYLGWGYGRPTRAGTEATREYSDVLPFPVESTYSAKALAGLLDLAGVLEGPVVFWSTKSAAPLPSIDASRLESAPPHLRSWLARASE